MEITGISFSINTNSSFSTARTELLPAADDTKIEETHRHHGHGRRGYHTRALDAFRQELRMTLKSHFHARFASTQGPYSQPQDAGTPDDVADEALRAAKQVVDEAPAIAAKSLISFRARVHETASYVRQAVGDSDNVGEIYDAVAQIDEGLDTLDTEVAGNRESSASILALDTRTKQRSTIMIRTQEGDIVKLSLQRVENISAGDVAASNGFESATFTEVQLSGHSGLTLGVEGDLNDSELAAIENVFASAGQIADQFFGGDLATAFSLAEGFEFDSGQLARVNMRFRTREVSEIAYAESAGATAIAAIADPVASEPPVAAAPDVATLPAGDETAAVADPVEVVDQPDAGPDDIAVPDASSALTDFFDALSAFLRSVGEGFSMEAGSGSISYHHSESFKLSLLKAVFHVVAPEESEDAATNAAALIDEVSE